MCHSGKKNFASMHETLDFIPEASKIIVTICPCSSIALSPREVCMYVCI